MFSADCGICIPELLPSHSLFFLGHTTLGLLQKSLRLCRHWVTIPVPNQDPYISSSLPSLMSRTFLLLCIRGCLGLSSRNRKINLSLRRPSFHMMKNYLHLGWDLLLY